ncbi:MAG: hypothetical protein H6741_22655 [Alphaproteobacteria bacterium]|nr:hypothetical protein [Alphaproteobacteria bacterium]MCB9795517.1 hypothetical protein [Alphaproteobacteria bacterium]
MPALLPLLLLLLGGPLSAAELKVRAGVVVLSEGPVDATALARTREDTLGVLAASGRYATTGLGAAGPDLAARCQESAPCWLSAARAAGLEQLVVLRVSADGEALVARCAVHGLGEGPREASGPLPRGGGAPLELLQVLLLDPGALALSSSTPGLRATLDGQPLDPDAALSPGKHHLRLEAEGHHSASLTFTALPNTTTRLEVELVEVIAPHPWRRVAVTAGLAAGGAGLVGALLAAPDPARR